MIVLGNVLSDSVKILNHLSTGTIDKQIIESYRWFDKKRAINHRNPGTVGTPPTTRRPTSDDPLM